MPAATSLCPTVTPRRASSAERLGFRFADSGEELCAELLVYLAVAIGDHCPELELVLHAFDLEAEDEEAKWAANHRLGRQPKKAGGEQIFIVLPCRDHRAHK